MRLKFLKLFAILYVILIRYVLHLSACNMFAECVPLTYLQHFIIARSVPGGMVERWVWMMGREEGRSRKLGKTREKNEQELSLIGSLLSQN